MSDEPKKAKGKWLIQALAALVVRVLRDHALRHGQLDFGVGDGWRVRDLRSPRHRGQAGSALGRAIVLACRMDR